MYCIAKRLCVVLKTLFVFGIATCACCALQGGGQNLVQSKIEAFPDAERKRNTGGRCLSHRIQFRGMTSVSDVVGHAKWNDGS